MIAVLKWIGRTAHVVLRWVFQAPVLATWVGLAFSVAAAALQLWGGPWGKRLGGILLAVIVPFTLVAAAVSVIRPWYQSPGWWSVWWKVPIAAAPYMLWPVHLVP